MFFQTELWNLKGKRTGKRRKTGEGENRKQGIYTCFCSARFLTPGFVPYITAGGNASARPHHAGLVFREEGLITICQAGEIKIWQRPDRTIHATAV